ncbi:DUF6232 family protein [Longispora albida]|uniref:DUF6232 family protein n=1 Tax=Longispora albida TaxID=203523 RepID=UPI0003823702|nr:DUF6232 family protein [Longispora albida]
MTTVYYDRGGIRITERCMELHGQCYPLAELSRIEVSPPSGVLAFLRIRRVWELWAEHRGVVTLIFTSRSERIFGQVRRALMRAREARPPQHV